MNTVSRMLNFRFFLALLFLSSPLWSVQGTKVPTITDRDSTWPRALSRLEQATSPDERKAAFKQLLSQLSINQLQTDRALLAQLEEQIQTQAEESLDSELFLLLGQWKQKSTTLAMNLWQLEQAPPPAGNQQRAIASKEMSAAAASQEEQSRAPMQWAALLLIALAMTVLVMITKKYRNY